MIWAEWYHAGDLVVGHVLQINLDAGSAVG